MKLFTSPGSCSLSAHIVLIESDLPYSLVRVDLPTHTLDDGADYYGINPRGSVPMLELDSGERISEVSAVVQYVADQVPEKELAPPNGTIARYRLQETLSFIASEIHKSYGVLFNPAVDECTKEHFRQRLLRKCDVMDRQLLATGWLVGNHFTVADAYLFVVTLAAPLVSLDLSGFVALGRFVRRIQERPAVQAAVNAESLI